MRVRSSAFRRKNPLKWELRTLAPDGNVVIVNTVGTLYIVRTPIGNLEDITLRALRILQDVDLSAAEDTRHTRKLLSAYDIHTTLTSYFEHNEAQKSTYLLQRLLNGESVALVSDAGTPGISDPGYQVIVAAIAQNVPVVPIPGPSALVTALSVAGLPFDNFVFIGFLHNKRSIRIKKLQELQHESKTLVCYASPHTLLRTLADIHEIFGNRRIVVTRELTKKFEEIVRGDVETSIKHFTQKSSIKGEFTLVIAGAQKHETAALNAEDILTELQKVMAEQECSKRDAVRYVAKQFEISKNEVYAISLQLS